MNPPNTPPDRRVRSMTSSVGTTRNECPAKWARQDWQKQQEINLCYVAATRAKQALYTIEAKQ